jgi:hypothetical protein
MLFSLFFETPHFVANYGPQTRILLSKGGKFIERFDGRRPAPIADLREDRLFLP